MRPILLSVLALLTVGAHAQPVDGARSTVKRVYNLAPPIEADDLRVGALRRTEVETYGTDGRRLRVDWRDPDGTVTLAFMELYGGSDHPFGAVYFEGDDLDPNLERNAYRSGDAPGTTVKRVTYSGADGVATSVNEFVLDADGRELERRYGNAEGAFRGSDTITYDGANQTGYVYESADGSRRSAYVYRVETTDARGNWTSRTVERNGEPRLFETRDIEYAP
ncbi:hypothetical protein [Rubrivirga sp.]|uniref:hypothetical protein n=1 Tax=Rubrivirga sp. TaxID=1885344 RepID=UPI003C766878